MDRSSGTKAQLWRSRIGAWSGSGLSQVEFCRREQLSRNAFTYWKKKLSADVDNDGQHRLVEIPVRPATDRSLEIGITLRNGIRLTIGGECTAARLRDIVQVLERV